MAPLPTTTVVVRDRGDGIGGSVPTVCHEPLPETAVSGLSWLLHCESPSAHVSPATISATFLLAAEECVGWLVENDQDRFLAGVREA